MGGSWGGHRGRLRLALGAACVALAGVVFAELDRPAVGPAMRADAPVPVAAPRVAETPRFAMPPPDRYEEVNARPLFSPTRRPPAPEAPGAGAAPEASFTLVGIVISTEDRLALLEHGQPPRIERVFEGQQLDGWSVEAILPDRVVLRHGGTREEVRPRDAPPGRPTRAPAPGRPQPASPPPPVATFPAAPGVAAGLHLRQGG